MVQSLECRQIEENQVRAQTQRPTRDYILLRRGNLQLPLECINGIFATSSTSSNSDIMHSEYIVAYSIGSSYMILSYYDLTFFFLSQASNRAHYDITAWSQNT